MFFQHKVKLSCILGLLVVNVVHGYGDVVDQDNTRIWFTVPGYVSKANPGNSLMTTNPFWKIQNQAQLLNTIDPSVNPNGYKLEYSRLVIWCFRSLNVGWQQDNAQRRYADVMNFAVNLRMKKIDPSSTYTPDTRNPHEILLEIYGNIYRIFVPGFNLATLNTRPAAQVVTLANLQNLTPAQLADIKQLTKDLVKKLINCHPMYAEYVALQHGIAMCLSVLRGFVNDTHYDDIKTWIIGEMAKL